VGAELKLALVDAIDPEKNDGSRGQSKKEILLGPSLQYRPLPQMHIDLAPLAGLNNDSPKLKPTLVIGWEF
jgi:hypothetical protein